MTAKPDPTAPVGVHPVELSIGLWERLRACIMPGAAEADPGFRAEVERLSIRALLIIAGVNVLMPLLGILFHGIVLLFEPRPYPPLWILPLNLASAVALVAVSRTGWGRRHARPIALVSGYVAAVGLTVAELSGGAPPSESQLASTIDVTVVMLVAVAAGPFRPLQTLGLAVAINATHFLLVSAALRRGAVEAVSLHHYAGMDLVALLCTALSAVLYQRLLEQYRSRQAQVEAQSRLLVSENAATMGRFAATLAHELNSPLGALRSTVDSLRRMETQATEVDPGRAEKLRAARDGLLQTARSATDSLHATVRRMERFTSLDRAEVTSVDLPQLLSDVAAVVEPELGEGACIRVGKVWRGSLVVHPRRVSAVLVRLLRYAAKTGAAPPVLEADASASAGEVRIRIRCKAVELDRDRVEQIFEPAFRVESSRVVGANWSLFQARQTIQEGGGDIAASLDPDGRLTLTVVLPLRHSAAPPY